MSKRRINHQQTARIQKKQKQYHQPSHLETLNTDGVIITRYASHALVQNENKALIRCLIRPNIDSLVTGDRVVWQPEGASQGVIISRYPRQSILGRPDKHGKIKLVAANITQMMVVVAAKPLITWSLLDSYLVLAEYLKLKVCIVLNKSDLACERIQQQLIQHYQPLGYSILCTSSHDSNSLTLLQEQLNHEVSIFLGQSGVGKSSLIEQILPHEQSIRIGALSTMTELGCHTTSNSYYYYLPKGGALIDSPGVREFGLWDMSMAAIAKGYREFQPFISKCKFRNCNHKNAPGCALISAVNQGLVSQSRYENFLLISQPM